MSASDTTPPNLLDLKAIVDSAFRNLGLANADADYQQESANQNLTRLLAESGKARGKTMVKSRENDSSRGFLHSGVALTNQADVSTAYDNQNANTQRSYDDVIREIAAKRLNAQNQYADAQAKYSQGVAQNTALKDPYNWAAIDADMKAKGLGPYAPGVSEEDPFGWAKIDADLKAAKQGPYAVPRTGTIPNASVKAVGPLPGLAPPSNSKAVGKKPVVAPPPAASVTNPNKYKVKAV